MPFLEIHEQIAMKIVHTQRQQNQGNWGLLSWRILLGRKQCHSEQHWLLSWEDIAKTSDTQSGATCKPLLERVGRVAYLGVLEA